VVEVDRPDRKLRRQRGKDDVTDAEGAARSVLSGQATGIPKSADGNVEMIRVLVTAGDNPERLSSEGSFAHLCGVAPLPASSGKRVDRHRLNKGGDRDANCALHMIAINRLSRCERTRAYVKKRSPDGKADLDILRRLKRYIAREVYNILTEDLPNPALERAA
jgi:transposase